MFGDSKEKLGTWVAEDFLAESGVNAGGVFHDLSGMATESDALAGSAINFGHAVNCCQVAILLSIFYAKI